MRRVSEDAEVVEDVEGGEKEVEAREGENTEKFFQFQKR